jgi:hypothetical protein
MDERRKWKSVSNEEGRKNCRRLNNELRRATDKAKLEYLESKCDEITELQRAGRYDLMYRKVKELDRKENSEIRTVGIEDPQGNMIVDQKKVLKIWEIYVEELYDRANQPENLSVELEEVNEDHKCPHILCSEVEKAMGMRDKKATGDDDVPVEALRLLGDDGLNLLTQLISNVYESGDWPKDFTEVTMVALKKKPKARKCTDHRTISLIAHVAKVVASVIRRRSEKKIEDVLGEDQFGFRKGRETRDAVGMLRIMSE